MTPAMSSEEILKEKDEKILALQKTINAFKEYDGKRTKYLRKIQDELEEYSERYLMLLNTLSETERDLLRAYEIKVSSLKTQVKALEKKIQKYKKLISKNISDDNLERLESVIASYDVVDLEEQNEKYKKMALKHKEDISVLVTKMLSLERRLSKIKETAESR